MRRPNRASGIAGGAAQRAAPVRAVAGSQAAAARLRRRIGAAQAVDGPSVTGDGNRQRGSDPVGHGSRLDTEITPLLGVIIAAAVPLSMASFRSRVALLALRRRQQYRLPTAVSARRRDARRPVPLRRGDKYLPSSSSIPSAHNRRGHTIYAEPLPHRPLPHQPLPQRHYSRPVRTIICAMTTYGPT